MKLQLKVAGWATALAFGLLTAACGTAAGHAAAAGAASSATPPSGTLAEDGSALVLPVMEKWAAAYQRQYPAATVTTTGGGSGQAIADAISGKVQIGTSDAYLSSGDVLLHPGLVNIPLVASAQLVIYNLPGVSQSRHINLSGTVLAEMYDGTITRWDDPRIAALNPGVTLPSIRVVPLVRETSSGDTFIFTQYLSTQNHAWGVTTGFGTTVAWPTNPADVAASTSTGQPATATTPAVLSIPQVCSKHPGCVDDIGTSYLPQVQGNGLGYAALRNSAGNFELPTTQAINASVAALAGSTSADGTLSLVDGPAVNGYPIVNYEYAIVNTGKLSKASAAQVRNFLTWVITTGNGTSFTTPVDFVPLPPDAQAVAQALIQGIS
jgi:phosphate transport system substrate-binding protein